MLNPTKYFFNISRFLKFKKVENYNFQVFHSYKTLENVTLITLSFSSFLKLKKLENSSFNFQLFYSYKKLENKKLYFQVF